MVKTSPLPVFITFICLCCVSDTTAQNTALTLKKGQSLYTLLATEKGDSLYGMMTPAFQAAVKGKEGFQALLKRIPDQLGRETKVDTEAVFEEAGFTSYYRISQFEQSPSVTIRFVWKGDGLEGLSVKPTAQPAPSEFLAYRTKTTLALPFKGTWYVAWGGRQAYLNYHVSATDQRFACDFMYTEKGGVAKDNPAGNEDYFGFGQPVFSPAAGTVIVAVDSVEDNRLGVVNSQSPPGNYIVIDHGNGEYSLLAHFKKGTLAVKPGRKVKAGDLLGQCGNSGQSTLPHLHYHLQTGKTYKEGVGLPAFFHAYQANGKKVTTGEPQRGQYLCPSN